MSEPTDDRSPALEAIRSLERRLAEQGVEKAAAEATLEAARREAARLRDAARARGAARADERRRQALERADRDAARIRAEGERRAEQRSVAMRARLCATVAGLESIVVPHTEGD